MAGVTAMELKVTLGVGEELGAEPCTELDADPDAELRAELGGSVSVVCDAVLAAAVPAALDAVESSLPPQAASTKAATMGNPKPKCLLFMILAASLMAYRDTEYRVTGGVPTVQRVGFPIGSQQCAATREARCGDHRRELATNPGKSVNRVPEAYRLVFVVRAKHRSSRSRAFEESVRLSHEHVHFGHP